MIYKAIDISQSSMYFVSEECAKAVIDWRIQIKKGITQRIFDNALKQAAECAMYGITAEDALDRWMESGWTGMKWVLAEVKRERNESSSPTIRSRSIMDDVVDTSWAH